MKTIITIENIEEKNTSSIIDTYLINELNNAGTSHTLFRYQKMTDTLKEVIDNLDNKQKASILDDIFCFMNMLISEIKRYDSNRINH